MRHLGRGSIDIDFSNIKTTWLTSSAKTRCDNVHMIIDKKKLQA